MSKIFLCHASEDAAVAEHIQLALLNAGYTVFFDERSLPPAGDYHSRIEAAIADCDLFVFLISPASIAHGRFTLTEMKLARERWASPVGRVLAVNLQRLSPSLLHPYLVASTLLTIEGNAPSEVRIAVDRLLKPPQAASVAPPASSRAKRRLVAAITAVVAALVATGAYFEMAQFEVTDPTGAQPVAMPVTPDVARLVVDSITLQTDADGTPSAVLRLKAFNIGTQPLLIDDLRVSVVGTSRTDGSILSKVYEPIKAVSLAPNEARPVELIGDRVTTWSRDGDTPSKAQARFTPHDFKFYAQLFATIGATGKRVVLDLEVPTPMPMQCGPRSPCVAVFDLNMAVGATGYKKCVALPAERGFRLDCTTRDAF